MPSAKASLVTSTVTHRDSLILTTLKYISSMWEKTPQIWLLSNAVKKTDIIITNDIGLAAMALTKGSAVINNSGLEYTDSNILIMLTNRHIRKERQRKTGRNSIHGVPCTKYKHKPFAQVLKAVINRNMMEEES